MAKKITNFERRIATMNSPKALKLKNSDGSYSTHSMAYASTDRGYIAYPTVVEMNKGTLTRLSSDVAVKYALATGEYKQFKPRPKGKIAESAKARAEAYAAGGYKPKKKK